MLPIDYERPNGIYLLHLVKLSLYYPPNRELQEVQSSWHSSTSTSKSRIYAATTPSRYAKTTSTVSERSSVATLYPLSRSLAVIRCCFLSHPTTASLGVASELPTSSRVGTMSAPTLTNVRTVATMIPTATVCVLQVTTVTCVRMEMDLLPHHHVSRHWLLHRERLRHQTIPVTMTTIKNACTWLRWVLVFWTIQH